ncbi:MAG: hypothetical protein IJC12_03660 [Peptococcaceae bacterium]|nr:hypothetical protein [Peptococcaceae bacterium]
MKNCTFSNFINHCSEENDEPDKIFLGYSYDSWEKTFVRLFYWGVTELEAIPCSPDEVDPNLFIAEGIFSMAEDYDRRYFNAFVKSGNYDDFISLHELDDLDLRYAAFLLYGMQDGDDRGWHTIEVVKNALRILIARVAETEEEVLAAYKL